MLAFPVLQFNDMHDPNSGRFASSSAGYKARIKVDEYKMRSMQAARYQKAVETAIDYLGNDAAVMGDVKTIRVFGFADDLDPTMTGRSVGNSIDLFRPAFGPGRPNPITIAGLLYHEGVHRSEPSGLSTTEAERRATDATIWWARDRIRNVETDKRNLKSLKKVVDRERTYFASAENKSLTFMVLQFNDMHDAETGQFASKTGGGSAIPDDYRLEADTVEEAMAKAPQAVLDLAKQSGILALDKATAEYARSKLKPIDPVDHSEFTKTVAALQKASGLDGDEERREFSTLDHVRAEALDEVLGLKILTEDVPIHVVADGIISAKKYVDWLTSKDVSVLSDDSFAASSLRKRYDKIRADPTSLTYRELDSFDRDLGNIWSPNLKFVGADGQPAIRPFIMTSRLSDQNIGDVYRTAELLEKKYGQPKEGTDRTYYADKIADDMVVASKKYSKKYGLDADEIDADLKKLPKSIDADAVEFLSFESAVKGQIFTQKMAYQRAALAAERDEKRSRRSSEIEVPEGRFVGLRSVAPEVQKQQIKNIDTTWDKEHHKSFTYEDPAIFEIVPSAEKKSSYAKALKTKGNEGTNFYHGTDLEAAGMIAVEGFKIVSSKEMKAGRMLGNGVYFATNSSKSIQYVGSHVSRSNKDRGVLIVSNAAKGKMTTNPDKPGDYVKARKGWVPSGSQGKAEGLLNEEYAFRDANDVLPKYWIEITRVEVSA